VQTNAEFDAVFPNVLLREAKSNLRDAIRWQIILACWDEYAACMRSALFGEDPGAEYEGMLLAHVADARQRANSFIKAYRLHGKHDQITREVAGVYGDLMKFASYYLGNVVGHGRDWRESSAVVAALEEHWFAPHFEKLEAALRDLAAQAGKWLDRAGFEALGDIAEDVIAEGGMFFFESPTHPGQTGVDLPFSPETLPS
jgi:hypothetical protein